MLCMYAPVSIRKCLTCVFSVFHVKKKENGSCYSHFWRWGEIQTFILLLLVCCFFYPQRTENAGAWPSLHWPLSHPSQKQSLREAVEFSSQYTVLWLHSSLFFVFSNSVWIRLIRTLMVNFSRLPPKGIAFPHFWGSLHCWKEWTLQSIINIFTAWKDKRGASKDGTWDRSGALNDLMRWCKLRWHAG